jgi:hypothetical protein
MPPVTDSPGRRQASPKADTLFLLGALAALTVATTRYGMAMDQDIWWHLRVGHWILAHGTVPDREMFSTRAMGQPWIAYSWLFEVIVARIFDVWGYRGMLALTTAAAFAYTAGLTVFLSRFVNLRRAMILSFTAYLALMPLKSPRPWLFTILFFTIELSLLWIAREENRPGWLLPIVPLFALWANVHIQFVYGLGLIGLFALESLLSDRVRTALSSEPRSELPPMWLWLLLAASSLATLLNPYGWNLYRVVAEYATQSAPLTYVTEMQAMPFRIPSNWICLAIICAAIFALGCARGKNLLLIALLAFGCWFGFRSQRDTWFPVTVAALALASVLREGAPEFVRSRARYWIAIPAGLAVSLGLLGFDGRFTNDSLRKEIAKGFPVKACDYVESHSLPNPLFNSYSWGGYLIWRLPNMPVSIDGRANLYESWLPTAVNTIRGEKNWAKDPDLAKARTIILEQDSSLAAILRVDQKFRIAYEDETAAVFQPITTPQTR